jgi:hypothetical protein
MKKKKRRRKEQGEVEREERKTNTNLTICALATDDAINSAKRAASIAAVL